MRIAVLQHRLRTHERMDLAAMLAQSEHAAEQGAQVLIVPRVPGLAAQRGLLDAFFRNVEERAPGVGLIGPMQRHMSGEPLQPRATALGRTLVLDDDDCIDPALFGPIQDAGCDSLVWLLNAEDSLQAEAAIELALDASLHLAPLVVIAAVTGHARGVLAAGIAVVVHLGEILAEGGEGEEIVIADIPSPAGFPERPRILPEPAPILVQRLAAHRTAGTR